MELTKVMAELAALTANGTLLTNWHILGSQWLNVLVKVTDFKSNKELVVVIDNNDEQIIMEQISKLRDMLNA